MTDNQKTNITTENNLNNESIFLYKLAEIFDNSKNYKLNFNEASELIKQYLQYPEDAEVIIKYKSEEYPKKGFSFLKTKWNLKQSFYTYNKQKVSIEVYYLKEHKTINESSFTESEKEFILKVSKILVGYLNILEAKHEISENRKQIEKQIEDKEYKLNELATLNRVQEIIKAGKSNANTLQEVCFELHKSIRYNEFVVAKIIFEGKVYASPKEFGDSELKPSKWNFSESNYIGNKKLKIEVYYLKKIPKERTKLFLDEEKDLIKRISVILKKYLSDKIKKKEDEKSEQKKQIKTTSSSEKKIEYNFINKNNRVRDIFHDLMPFKVKEILLFANLYDAYSMEKEGRYSDNILGEYYQLNLTTVPRITSVSSFDETFDNLYSKHFDMVIIMTGQDKKIPIELSTCIKKEFNYIPVFLLLNNNADISYYQEPNNELKYIDDVFVWNGDSKIFFTIVKLLEDRVNIENDTQKGFARVILLVEDSARYYSRYLPLLYTSVLNQTKRIIDDVSKLDELYKMLAIKT